MQKTRKSNLRTPKKIIILVCEGSKTEINYFEGIFKSNPKNKEYFTFKAYQPTDYSPLGIVQQCISELDNAYLNNIKKSDLSVWAVFDKDQHAYIEKAFQKAKSKKIKIIFSSICFEYWVLLHYRRTTRPFKNCVELIHYLKTNFISEYDKGIDLYCTLRDKVEIAIRNSKWLVEQVTNVNINSEIFKLNPYTNAHE